MNRREIDIILKKVAQGDNVAFERLYIETKRGVYGFLLSYFNNSADCEDAMQNTYLKIRQNICQYKSGSNGLAWILQIAKNTALNELRAKANREKLLPEVVETEHTFDNFDTKDAIVTIMKRVLDEEEQRIVILHAVWGYKHKEIAALLNVSLGTVTSKYKRAVDKIKTAWKEEQL